MYEHALSGLIVFPLLASVVTLLVGRWHVRAALHTAMLSSLVSLVASFGLLNRFDVHQSGLQFKELCAWAPTFGLWWQVGVDGVGLSLIVLSALMTTLVLMYAYRSHYQRMSWCAAAFLAMQGCLNGIFASENALMFYIFWEAVLIPMYAVIGLWGSQRRLMASMKFFLYTFLGSALMLLAILYLGGQTDDFSISRFYDLVLPLPTQMWLFGAFFMAFAVKVPMWPVHTWLPDAHTEAPAEGSMMLAAVMLKLGVYGFIRFILPVLPDACMVVAWPVIGLSLIAIIYIGLVALVQKDLKRLVAYSSIAHMGIVTLGLFIAPLPEIHDRSLHAYLGLDGALYQMLAHGFSSAALFACVGMMYDRLHTRKISEITGLVNRMPVLTAFMVLFAMANVGLPGTSGFVGEFMVILASFKVSFGVAFGAALTLILAAAYTLWMVKRVFWGKVVHDTVAQVTDINTLERTILSVLAVGVLGMGLYPAPILTVLHAARCYG